MKNKKSAFVGTYFFVLLFGVSAVGWAQDNSTERLRLAQGLEEAGEWEQAVAMYESLYATNPTNYLYIDGLQRSYTQIKEYGKAIAIIRRWLALQPRDLNLMTRLGGLYYDSGREAAADSTWRAVIAIEPQNMQMYHVVANEMMEHRLYDKCIQLYLDGRSISKNETMFADDLGNLYIALQRYSAATQEYAQLVQSSPDQLSLAQARLSTFTSKSDALQVASQVVGKEIDRTPNNIALHRLYGWLLMEARHYDPALEQYQTIDKLSGVNGNELFSFAQRLIQEGAYRTAAAAFKTFLEQYNNQPLVPYARFGYARAMEELGVEADSGVTPLDSPTSQRALESQANYRNAIHLYESLIAERPNPDLLAQSLFRIGTIKFEKLFDLTGALDALYQIKNIPITSNIFYEATLLIGTIHEARNELAEARKTFVALKTVPITTYRDRAAFKLAELDYFETKFDSSLAALKVFDTNLNTDLANDALQLQYFIQENKASAPQALAEFARADLLLRQRKYSESLVQFQDIVQRYPSTMLVDDAMMKIGKLFLFLRQPAEALKAYRFVVDSIQLSILQDEAQFDIGEVYQTDLKDKAAAIEAYEKLLARYPNSLYAEEARKRIRILRGDSI